MENQTCQHRAFREHNFRLAVRKRLCENQLMHKKNTGRSKIIAEQIDKHKKTQRTH